ncbi:MAG: dihydrolipoyl dehydrogenase [Pseudomonadota bacterium]
MQQHIVVIGGGPGGYVAAVRAAQQGARVSIVERDNVGGTCLNWGCIPSKILKETADRLMDAGRWSDFGVDLDGAPRLNLPALNDRKARVIDAQRKGVAHLLARHKITCIAGTARIDGPGRVVVSPAEGEPMTLAWDRLILATGSVPTPLPGTPFDGERVWSSDHALYRERLPASLVIIGGGVIGCEFAAIYHAFGVAVTVVEALDRLLPLPSVDAGISKVLAREMKKKKIPFYVNRVVTDVHQSAAGLDIRLGPSPASGEPSAAAIDLSAEAVLVCIGRRAGTGGLGLESIGVAVDARGWIVADAAMRTTADGVFAIGDVLGPQRVMLAHVASAEGMVAAENATGGDRVLDYTAVPGAIFTSPEVATVGLTEAQAMAEGIDCRADTVQFRTIGKAQVIDEIAGEVKMISHRGTGKILGVHMIGPHVTDLIAEATLAVRTGCTTSDLVNTIHAHPTLAEIMLETGYKAVDQSLHG